jgi:hypothetical protein
MERVVAHSQIARMNPMAIRTILQSLLIALIGGVIGSYVTLNIRNPHPDNSRDEIVTRELVIVDDQHEPAARLTSSGGTTTLKFYGPDRKTALELGLGEKGARKYLHFIGRNEFGVVGLDSGPPHGEATLVLGDERWEGRIILGALRGDVIEGPNGVNEWGMQVRKPNASGSLFDICVRPSSAGYKASMRLERENGESWVVH